MRKIDEHKKQLDEAKKAKADAIALTLNNVDYSLEQLANAIKEGKEEEVALAINSLNNYRRDLITYGYFRE